MPFSSLPEESSTPLQVLPALFMVMEQRHLLWAKWKFFLIILRLHSLTDKGSIHMRRFLTSIIPTVTFRMPYILNGYLSRSQNGTTVFRFLNSRYVYFGCSGYIQGIEQYDFQTQLFYFITASGCMGMQLGPDEKIYCVMSGSPYNLSVINTPDSVGPLVNYTANAINLKRATVSYGLPEFLDDFVYPNTTVSCALPVSAFTTSDQTICPDPV